MIKRTLCFTNPAYLSLKDKQMVIRLPEVEKSDMPDILKKESVRTIPVEDIGVVVLDNRQITLTHGLLEALLENNCSVVTCDSHSMPVGLMLRLSRPRLTTRRLFWPPAPGQRRDVCADGRPTCAAATLTTLKAERRRIIGKASSSACRGFLVLRAIVRAFHPTTCSTTAMPSSVR